MSVTILIVVFVVYITIKNMICLTIVNAIASFIMSALILGVLAYLFLLEHEEEEGENALHKYVLRN